MMLLKSYSANFTRMIGEALQEQNLAFLEHFFLNASDLVKVVLPFKTYVKKLAIACCKISVSYSKIDRNAILLGFNTLKFVM